MNPHIAAGDLEMGRPEGERGFQNPVDPPAEDALAGAGHAHVALEGRAAGENLLVGGGHVRMGPEDRRDAAVEMAPHDLHVAGRLGVEVEQDHADVVWNR